MKDVVSMDVDGTRWFVRVCDVYRWLDDPVLVVVVRSEALPDGAAVLRWDPRSRTVRDSFAQANAKAAAEVPLSVKRALAEALTARWAA